MRRCTRRISGSRLTTSTGCGHPEDDAYWQAWSIRRRWAQVTVPAINFEGWYDLFVNGAIENFVGMRKNGGSQLARDGQRLVIGPWVHLGWQQKVGDIDFGPEAVSPMPELMKRWYDYWLKGVKNGVDTEPRVRVFVMGANKWRTSNDWPIEGTEYRKYYLHSKGAANTASGDGTLDTKKPDAEGPADKYQIRSEGSGAEHRRAFPAGRAAWPEGSASASHALGRSRLHDASARE